MNISQIPEGEGWAGKVDDEPVAIYNDKGNLVVLQNICTHLRCQTGWNSDEKTWDCPCHGSRYHADGTNLRGPARMPLTKLNYKLVDGQIKIEG